MKYLFAILLAMTIAFALPGCRQESAAAETTMPQETYLPSETTFPEETAPTEEAVRPEETTLPENTVPPTEPSEEMTLPEETTVPEETLPPETSQPTIHTYDYPEVHDKLSWDAIHSYPIASADMTTEELRDLCVAFFRFSKTFAWTPSDDYFFIKNNSGTGDNLEKGKIYGGLPYVGYGSGNVYRILDYYDTETGVLDVSKIGDDPYLFGNQCSIGAYCGWGRVVNSARYDWTTHMVQSRGFLRVGPYTYDDSLTAFDSVNSTYGICETNSQQTMFESYAQLLTADGLVHYRTSGHVIMCSAPAVVVRNEDGTINGKESYILKIDQSHYWEEYQQSNGDIIHVKTGIDVKQSFAQLFAEGYIPFTFGEFLGTDPVEDLDCALNHTELEITPTELSQAEIISNYAITDIYVSIIDGTGNPVCTAVSRQQAAGVMQVSLADDIDVAELKNYTDGCHTVEIIVQLANGERPLVYSGTLTE